MDGAEHYDRYVAPFTIPYTAAVLASVERQRQARAGVPPDRRFRVLDHGAGTGAVAVGILLADPNAEVVAVDPNHSMLTRLQGLAEEFGVAARLTIVEGTADALPSDIRFDAVTSSLVFMFIADAGAELSALADLARPGAPLAVTVLGPPSTLVPFEAFWGAVHRVIAGTAEPASYPHFGHTHTADLVSAMTASGWCDATVSTIESFRTLDCDELWTWVGRALGVRMVDGSYRKEPLTDEETTAVRAELCRSIAPYRETDGCYRLPVHGWLVTAIRAG